MQRKFWAGLLFLSLVLNSFIFSGPPLSDGTSSLIPADTWVRHDVDAAIPARITFSMSRRRA